eukprot:TRINITY_DN66526_c0_g1_i1.p1 TRINITY_DN66526_c0_g1~~TRINITY_DN66526_c0_g1_i1.p1  ORF type:complete len:350 (+),score=64.78 TRINITY_DN66526_c0_g1_i1:70-1119(+)
MGPTPGGGHFSPGSPGVHDGANPLHTFGFAPFEELDGARELDTALEELAVVRRRLEAGEPGSREEATQRFPELNSDAKEPKQLTKLFKAMNKVTHTAAGKVQEEATRKRAKDMYKQQLELRLTQSQSDWRKVRGKLISGPSAAEMADQHRETLFGAGAAAAAGAAYAVPEGADGAASPFTGIMDVQRDGIDAARRVQQHAIGANKVGDHIITQMQVQQETLLMVSDDLDTLEAQIKRARRDLSGVVRSMATDKCVVCFTILILLVFCVVIGFAIFRKSQSGGDETDPAMPPPSTVFVDDPAPSPVGARHAFGLAAGPLRLVPPPAAVSAAAATVARGRRERGATLSARG